MSISWNEYSGAVDDPRFLAPLWEFEYRVDFVPVMVDGDRLARICNLISGSVVQAIRSTAACPLSAITAVKGEVADDKDPTKQPTLFHIANTSPVYDFGLQVGRKTFRIFKLKTSVQDLIKTLPIFQSICDTLFSPRDVANDGGEGRVGPLIHLLEIEERIHRVSFTFELRMRLGSHIAERNRDATNVELIRKLGKTQATETPAAGIERDAPLAALQPEGFLRGDFDFSMLKTFHGRQRNIWVGIDAPFNISQKDVDFTFSYRCGEGCALEPEDLTDWSTPLISFYRDMILNRFFPALLFDIHIEPRIA